MREHKSVFLLIAIMITTCLSIAGTGIAILYKTGIEGERARLMETVQSQARLIESVARFNKIHNINYLMGAKSATLSQIIDAHKHYTGCGETGEFTISEKKGENMVFLLSHRQHEFKNPEPVPFKSALAEPMRRALLGQSGTLIGPDYHGERVLAAHEPVSELNLGIVAKINMSEVRAPYVRAGLITVFFTGLFVAIGAVLFIRVTDPMVRQLEKRALELKPLNDDMEAEINERKQVEEMLRESERQLKQSQEIAHLGSWELDLTSNKLTWSDEVYRIFGIAPEAFGATYEAFLAHVHPDDRATVDAAYFESLRENLDTYEIEHRVVRKDTGDIRVVHEKCEHLRDATGKIIRSVGMIHDITERKRAEEDLLDSEREMTIRSRISDTFLTFSDENVYSETLKVVLEAMGSDKGFFGYIDENGDLVSPSLTRNIWDQCMIPDKTFVFPRDSWGGLWGKSLLEKKTLYSNDPLSVPKGHIPLNRALAVPIIFRDELVGQIVVANKEIDYDQKDRNLLKSIVDSMAPILKARLQRDNLEIKRRKAEEALRKAHDELEHRVDVRTAELNETNRELKREIEERKKAERSVSESEERYALAVSGSTDGIWDWNILSDTVFYSERFREFLGYSAEEFPNTLDAFRRCLHPDDADAVWTAVERHLQERVPYNIYYRLKTKWGKYRWFHARAQALWDSKGNATRMAGSIQDITDHKKQEEALQKSEKLLQSVFNGITDPLLLMDKNLKVRIVNDAAMQYYQIKEPADMKEECCYKAFLGKSVPCEGCHVPAAIAGMKKCSFERKGLMNPGKLEQVTIYPLDENEYRISGALMRVQDITESRLMERKMVQNEKLALLGFAISCISHEITNPVSAITFNAPILQDYINAMISIVDDYAKNREDFELFQMPYPQFRDDVFKIMANILHASKRVRTTVSDLRKLYGNKKQQKEKRWVDLKQLIQRTTSLVGVEIGQYVKSFEINVPENLPQIYTDPDAVEHILTNLLNNAAHAADKKDSRVKLDVIQGDTWKDNLIIKISDNGCGMDPETLSKIFDPFFSTKPVGQGTGLGLYVTRDLVKDLEGRIEVQSEPGKGSVFSVVFPDIERRSAKRV